MSHDIEVLSGDAPVRGTDGRAVLALVLAVVSWVSLPVVLAVVALVVARSAERAVAAGAGHVGGQGLITAARWVAGVQLLLVGMAAAFLAAFFVALWIAP